MRLIEQQMLTAVHDRANWSKDNTMVKQHNSSGNSFIMLHGHHIATYNHDTPCILANRSTFIDWPTRTTASRLRALGIKASLKQGQAAIDGVILL